MRFFDYGEALTWAKTHAGEYCFPFHTWRIVRRFHRGQPPDYRIAVYSRNTGKLSHYV